MKNISKTENIGIPDISDVSEFSDVSVVSVLNSSTSTRNQDLLESNTNKLVLLEGLQNDEKFFYIRGKFATIETMNGNKRIYPRKLWEREVEKYQKEIENGTVNTLMEWEHPENRLNVEPKNAIAKITKLWIEGDFVMGEAVIFDNPQAETLKSMIRHGVKISVSSRARGRVGAGNIVSEFNLITFDIVTTPSDPSATMNGILESQEYEISSEASTESDLLVDISESEFLYNISNRDTNNHEEIHDNYNLDGVEMEDNAMTENLIEILRTKNIEILDLRDEIDILKERMNESSHGSLEFRESDNLDLRYEMDLLKESVNESTQELLETLEDRDEELVSLYSLIESRDEIIDILQSRLHEQDGSSEGRGSKAPTIRTRSLLEAFDKAGYEIPTAIISDVASIINSEISSSDYDRGYGYEYEQRTAPVDSYYHRHQDVNSTVEDSDPSGYYASGETEYPEIRSQLDGEALDDEIRSRRDIHGSTRRLARLNRPYDNFESANNGMVTYRDGVDRGVDHMNNTARSINYNSGYDRRVINESKKSNRFTIVPSHLI